MVNLISNAKVIFLFLELGFTFLEFIFFKKKNHEGVTLCCKCGVLCFIFVVFFGLSELIIRCLK